MADRFLVGIAVVVFCAFGLVLGAFALINRVTDTNSTTIVQTPDVATPTSPRLAVAPASPAPEINSEVSPPGPAPAMNSSQATGKTVTTLDLNNLAHAVKLYSGATKNLDKDVWAAQLPVAQGLLQGCCDCGQRNWLNRFVETANDAQNGSKDYFASVQILSDLARNDVEETGGTASN